ncbi:MAG: helix-turn-helix transcriptional regulator [bacterium]|nr:helix-turn-helix transcriptional regulator [bacterium]
MPFQRPAFRADKLTAARNAAGLSRATVADRLGVARSRVHAWETGEATPHARHIPALARLLGVAATTYAPGDDLRARRYRAGLTQAEAAAQVGAARPEWSRWESGLRIPDRHAAAVARLLSS